MQPGGRFAAAAFEISGFRGDAARTTICCVSNLQREWTDSYHPLRKAVEREYELFEVWGLLEELNGRIDRVRFSLLGSITAGD